AARPTSRRRLMRRHHKMDTAAAPDVFPFLLDVMPAGYSDQRSGAGGSRNPSAPDTPPASSSASQSGPSRSMNSTPIAASSRAGAMASEVQTMHPAITDNPRLRAPASSSSACVRPPLLSSLMLTHW